MMDKRAGLKQHFKDESNRSMAIQHHKERMQLAKDNQETLVHLMEALVDFLDKKVTKTEVTNQLKSISTPDVDKAVVAINKLDKAIASNKVDIQPIRNELQAIKRELSLLPKDHAKQLDTIKVSNLKDIIIPKLDTSNLEKLIKNLKLAAEAPIINTEKTDITPLLDAIANVVKSIQKNKPLDKVEITNFPEQKVTDLAKIEKKLDESNKHLKKIVEKPTGGGGGGGGNGTPYIDSTGKPMNVELTSDGKIPVDVDMATEGIATETTLASIKDTDGIKKITDPVTIDETDYQKVKYANDMVKTVNYTDATKAVVSSIVMSSVTVGKTVTETLDNSGATTLVITRGVA